MGEINIPIEEIRVGIIKSIETLLDKVKCDDDSKLSEILTNTGDILIQNNNNQKTSCRQKRSSVQ
jgi:hypothetical protein